MVWWVELLEGKLVNLKVLEKDDLQLLADWSNNPEFFSDMWFPQMSRTEWEKRYDGFTPDTKWFFIEKKDGMKIGTVFHFLNGNFMEIGYILVPNERKKGYGSEAIKIIVDYLFLSKELVRVQAITGVDNFASHRVLEKAGFTKEGIIRKSAFIRGEWKDGCLYSILREEWKEPKILTKTA
jgi:ribosomal-protein-alanine N-acetyltransferase